MQILLVVSEGDLDLSTLFLGIEVFPLRSHVFQIMRAPVEMDQVPLFLALPLLDLGNSLGCGSPVGRDPVQVDLSLEQGPGGQGVADTDRVPDDQNVG